MKDKFYKFFSCNFFKLFINNFRNNKASKYSKNLYNLIFKRELLIIAFAVFRFLALFAGAKEFYVAFENSFFVFVKSVIFECFLWFAILSFLSLFTIIFNNTKIKCKFYLILVLFYLLSNLFYTIMIAFFVSIFMLNFIIGLIGIIISICIIIFNILIVDDFMETNLKS